MAFRKLIVALLLGGVLVAGIIHTSVESSPHYHPSLLASLKIIGGVDAPSGLYPYQVSLQIFDKHICGGSIVHKNWIVTAAHCVILTPAAFLKIMAGSNRLNETYQEIHVLKVYVHEKFNFSTFANDVAILETQDIVFDDRVAPIPVEKSFVVENYPVTLSGWGTTAAEGPMPNDLQHVRLLTTSVRRCKEAHLRAIYATQLCTVTEGGEGACHGDSGGPLVAGSGIHTTLVGIVSWGTPCATRLPDVSSRVSAFADWFDQKCSGCLAK